MENEILTNAWQYYYYLALFATICFVIKLIIFTIFGGDSGSEVSADFNTETDTDTSFGFLSLQSILAFLMGFGWMGFSALQQFKLGQLTAFLCAFVVGFIFMYGTAFLMFSVKKLEKNVKKDKTSALEKVGKAYTDFASKGQGRIEIEINGQLTVAEAINDSETEIKSFEAVKVIKVENNLLYITKIN